VTYTGMTFPRFGILVSSSQQARPGSQGRDKLWDMAQFALILSPANENEPQVDLTCAISGDNDRWQGKTKRFTNREQAEKALLSAGVLRDRVSDERLNGLDKGVPAAYFVEPKAAIDLQVLYRRDPRHEKERTFIRFHDLRGRLMDQTKEDYLDQEVQVGDVLSVNTPIGPRTVRIENIRTSEVKRFGSDETRREMHVDVNF